MHSLAVVMGVKQSVMVYRLCISVQCEFLYSFVDDSDMMRIKKMASSSSLQVIT